MNKVILYGTVGTEPEVSESKTGNPIVKFRLATNSGWGDNKTTDWHTIVAFGKVAGIAEKFVTKGLKLYIDGRISYNKYNEVTYTSIIVDNIELPAKSQTKPQEESQNNYAGNNQTEFAGEKIPF